MIIDTKSRNWIGKQLETLVETGIPGQRRETDRQWRTFLVVHALRNKGMRWNLSTDLAYQIRAVKWWPYATSRSAD